MVRISSLDFDEIYVESAGLDTDNNENKKLPATPNAIQ
jgi:hypothetical protein